MKQRCKEKGCDFMSVTRGWCGTHYKRWQLWRDPSSATRKAAALKLAGSFHG